MRFTKWEDEKGNLEWADPQGWLHAYVRHSSPVLNVIMKHALPFLEPTRHQKTLRKFSNYEELWA